jgi:hypothetical protein
MLDMRVVVGHGVEALDEDHLYRSFICTIPPKSVAQKASRTQYRIRATLHTAAVVERTGLAYVRKKKRSYQRIV